MSQGHWMGLLKDTPNKQVFSAEVHCGTISMGCCSGVGQQIPLEKHPWASPTGSIGNGLSTQAQCLIYHSSFVHCLQLVL